MKTGKCTGQTSQQKNILFTFGIFLDLTYLNTMEGLAFILSNFSFWKATLFNLLFYNDGLLKA